MLLIKWEYYCELENATSITKMQIRNQNKANNNKFKNRTYHKNHKQITKCCKQYMLHNNIFEKNTVVNGNCEKQNIKIKNDVLIIITYWHDLAYE